MTTVDYRAIARGFPSFNSREINDFIAQFQSFDQDKSGSIDRSEVGAVLRNLGEAKSDAEVTALIKEVDLDDNATIEFNEFLQLMSNIKSGKVNAMGGMAGVVTKQGNRLKIQGKDESTEHSFSEEERQSFVEHINLVLASDPKVSGRLPINPDSMDIFTAVQDGVILCKLINDAVPGTIDERVLNVKAKLNKFEIVENQNLCVNSAKAIGCNVTNLGADDLMEGRPHMVLGLLWQIIRVGLLSKLNLANHPELFRLLLEGETLEDFMKLPPDQILLRWMNYHLKNANHPKTVTNFGKDIKDSEAYTVLMNQLSSQCTLTPLREADLTRRADQMLENAAKINCRRFVQPADVVKGNAKLNFAFVANMFNTCPGLTPLTEEEKSALDAYLFNSEGDREARAFCLWINCLGVEPFVTNLFEDLKDGLVLLRVFDKVQPGIVDWSKVNQKLPLSKFKALENCNYAVVLGKQLKFSLVGVGGSDINDGVKTLTLAVVWQLMRAHIFSVLEKLSSGGAAITDRQLIKWANDKVGGSATMNDFKDPTIKTGAFFLALLNAMRPGMVDQSLATPGATDEDALMNAKYIISMARKIGATIFLLPEDIVEVKPKMILTLVGTLMAVDKGVSA